VHTLREKLNEFADSIVQRVGWRGGVSILALLLLLLMVGGAWNWYSSRWRPPPSIFDSPVQDVMGYLAMDDFSKLPVEDRIAFLLDFADRFRGLDQSESAVLAGFLAGLAGPAREQLTANVRTLAKDILADGASRFLAIEDEAERRRFMDEWLVEWIRTGERLTRGRERERSDEDRLAGVRRDGQREATRRPDRDVALTDRDAVAFMDFWQQEVESSSTPREQGQIVYFLTELRDHILR